MKASTKLPKAAPAQVLIVDDQALYREGLHEIMKHWPEFQVVGEAADGWHALSFCRKHRPDMVVMDNNMPMMAGVEAARRIIQECESTTVVMLTVSVDENDLMQAFDAGVRGYLLKETPSRQLRVYLKEALKGETVVSASVAKFLVSKAVARPYTSSRLKEAEPDAKLDADERDVVRLVARGLSNEAIGAELYISPGLVKKRLRAIMDKLSLSNRVQVAVYAVRHGLADDAQSFT